MNNKIINEFIGIIKDLIESEKNPIRSDVWLVPQLHEKRRELWNKLSEKEKENIKSLLKDEAKWL